MLHLFSVIGGEWVCSLITEYPFIGYFPVVIVMSISHVSDCARMCQDDEETRSHILNCLCVLPSPVMERETVGYNYRAAPGMAMTGNRAILLSSHSPSEFQRFRRDTVAGNGGSRL